MTGWLTFARRFRITSQAVRTKIRTTTVAVITGSTFIVCPSPTINANKNGIMFSAGPTDASCSYRMKQWKDFFSCGNQQFLFYWVKRVFRTTRRLRMITFRSSCRGIYKIFRNLLKVLPDGEMKICMELWLQFKKLQAVQVRIPGMLVFIVNLETQV